MLILRLIVYIVSILKGFGSEHCLGIRMNGENAYEAVTASGLRYVVRWTKLLLDKF